MDDLPFIGDLNDDLAGKKVLVRVDYNVPVVSGKVSDDTRLKASLNVINFLRKQKAKIGLLSHFGKPKEPFDPEFSLKIVVDPLSDLLAQQVHFIPDCVGNAVRDGFAKMRDGDVLLLENTRFYEGETGNGSEFVAQLAEHGDLFVNDAFSVSHRAHASTHGLALVLPSYAGHHLKHELENLDRHLNAPAKPVMAIVGGAKISTKMSLLESLTKKTDILVVGGAMANTFLLANGHKLGTSLVESSKINLAQKIMDCAKKNACELILPIDVVTAKEFKANAESDVAGFDQVDDNQMVLDVGPETVNLIAEKMDVARTLLWNGPLGAFELEPFHVSTVEAAQYAAKRIKNGDLAAVAGGGDTVSALNIAGVLDVFDFVSTGGGAFLEWVEGKELPAVGALTH